MFGLRTPLHAGPPSGMGHNTIGGEPRAVPFVTLFSISPVLD